MRSFFAGPSAPTHFPLTRSADADVCVVGGGLTGVSSALHLLEAGLSVVLLEADSIGSGATAISAGHILSGFLQTPAHISKRLGAEAALRLHRLSLEGTERLTHRLHDFADSCDYKPGYIFVGLTRAHAAALTSMAEFWRDTLGHQKLRFLTRPEVSEFLRSPLYCCGIYDCASGSLDPVKLLLNLSETAKRRDCRIYEHSPALRISEAAHRRLVVDTDQGSVVADHVVIGGNFDLAGLSPKPKTFTAESRTSVIVTDPLEPEMLTGTFARTCAGSDWREAGDYWTVTPSNRLIFGGTTTSAEPEKALLWRLKHVFPPLHALKADRSWSGRIDHTRNKLPRFCRQGRNIWIAHGYNGVGLSLAYLAGSLIADAIRGRDDDFQTFAQICHRPISKGRESLAA